MNDEVLARLRAADPLATSSTSSTDARKRALFEEITAMSNIEPTTDSARRVPKFAAAAAAAAVFAVGVGVVALRGGDSTDTPPLALTYTAGDPFASCPVFDPTVLAASPVAFGGVVTSFEGEVATLTVDTVYAGEVPDTVTLTVPGGASATALDLGVELNPGTEMLIAAGDGAVLGCGLTMVRTAETSALYAEAFGR